MNQLRNRILGFLQEAGYGTEDVEKMKSRIASIKKERELNKDETRFASEIQCLSLHFRDMNEAAEEAYELILKLQLALEALGVDIDDVLSGTQEAEPIEDLPEMKLVEDLPDIEEGLEWHQK